MTHLSDVREAFEQYIVLKDKYILNVIFATIVGNALIERDPIWLLIVAPSSGGKSTLLAPLVGLPQVFFIDDLTSKTLLSGFKGKKETSLLKIIGSGIMAFSDFTSILTKDPTSLSEILTQLKLVYDRKVTKYTGLGATGWEGKIGAVAASTPDIYPYMERGRSLGERFTYYWFEQPTNDEIITKQEEVRLSSKEITSLMQEYYAGYYADLVLWTERNTIPELILTPEQQEAVRKASIFCVHGKATIHTNFKTGKPDAIPNIAGVGRDIKIFNTLLHALLLMKAYEEDDVKATVDNDMIAIIEKCAYSSINRERRKILEILVERDGAMTSSQIGSMAGLGLEKDSVELYLHPLHAIGIIKKATSSGAHRWFIDDPWTIEYIKRVGPATHDLTPVAGTEFPPEEVDENESQLDAWINEAQKSITQDETTL